MTGSFRNFGFALGALGPLALAGCVEVYHHDSYPREERHVYKEKGPPPHAPAHGWRRKHEREVEVKVETVWDADIGIYVVVGHPHHYYDGRVYYRVVEDRWERCADFGGRYVVMDERDLPPGLRKKHHGKGKKHHDKHVPAKHDY